MHKTAYDMRISDWSSDVCSSDLLHARVFPDPQSRHRVHVRGAAVGRDRDAAAYRMASAADLLRYVVPACAGAGAAAAGAVAGPVGGALPVRRAAAVSARAEGHTSELQSLMRISYAVLSLKKQSYRAN